MKSAFSKLRGCGLAFTPQKSPTVTSKQHGICLLFLKSSLVQVLHKQGCIKLQDLYKCVKSCTCALQVCSDVLKNAAKGVFYTNYGKSLALKLEAILESTLRFIDHVDQEKSMCAMVEPIGEREKKSVLPVCLSLHAICHPVVSAPWCIAILAVCCIAMCHCCTPFLSYSHAVLLFQAVEPCQPRSSTCNNTR